MHGLVMSFLPSELFKVLITRFTISLNPFQVLLSEVLVQGRSLVKDELAASAEERDFVDFPHVLEQAFWGLEVESFSVEKIRFLNMVNRE